MALPFAVYGSLVWVATMVGADSAGQSVSYQSATPPSSESSAVSGNPLATVDPSMNLQVMKGRSVRLRNPAGIRRAAIDNPKVVGAIQVSPSEVMVMGKHAGIAQVTVWTGKGGASSGGDAPVVILVRVPESQ